MPDSRISIRSAKVEDVDLIRDFIIRLARYEKLEDQAILTADDLRATLFGDNPAAHVIIANYNDQPSGFALYFNNYSTFLAKPGIYLEDLFVLQDKRGLGIGTALLRHLAHLCVTNNWGRLEWSVLDWNQPAIRVYEGLGAKSMKEWITYRLDGQGLEHLARPA